MVLREPRTAVRLSIILAVFVCPDSRLAGRGLGTSRLQSRRGFNSMEPNVHRWDNLLNILLNKCPTQNDPDCQPWNYWKRNLLLKLPHPKFEVYGSLDFHWCARCRPKAICLHTRNCEGLCDENQVPLDKTSLTPVFKISNDNVKTLFIPGDIITL